MRHLTLVLAAISIFAATLDACTQQNSGGLGEITKQSSEYLLVFRPTDRLSELTINRVSSAGLGLPGAEIYLDLDRAVNPDAKVEALDGALKNLSRRTNTYKPADSQCREKMVLGRPGCLTDQTEASGLITYWNTAGGFSPTKIRAEIAPTDDTVVSSEPAEEYEIWVIANKIVEAKASVIFMDGANAAAITVRQSGAERQIFERVLYGLLSLKSKPRNGTVNFIDLSTFSDRSILYQRSTIYLH
jgi:hypothetical protein